MSSELYRNAVVVDATAPLSPFSTFSTTFTAEAIVGAYGGSGVTLAVFTVVDDDPNSIEQTIRLIGKNRQYFLSQPSKFVLADRGSDVLQAKQEKKLAVALAFQGTNALMGDLSLVEVYRRLGIVQMLLAYNVANFAADGCHEIRNAGLTRFGRQLIAEMNRVGMIVDLSHVGVRSSLDAMELTTKPPLFSHSTPNNFVPHDRNITDEQIRTCAAKDGVICVTGLGLFMDARQQKASAEGLAETIDYVAQLVGARHAGVGLDFIIDQGAMARYIRTNTGIYGGGTQYPRDGIIDFAPPAILPQVADKLSRRGYSPNDLRGVLGENYLRVLDAAGTQIP